MKSAPQGEAKDTSVPEINLIIAVESRMDGQLFKSVLERPRQRLKVISYAVSKAEFATSVAMPSGASVAGSGVLFSCAELGENNCGTQKFRPRSEILAIREQGIRSTFETENRDHADGGRGGFQKKIAELDRN
jgi:hypothetical protein